MGKDRLEMNKIKNVLNLIVIPFLKKSCRIIRDWTLTVMFIKDCSLYWILVISFCMTVYCYGRLIMMLIYMIILAFKLIIYAKCNSKDKFKQFNYIVIMINSINILLCWLLVLTIVFLFIISMTNSNIFWFKIIFLKTISLLIVLKYLMTIEYSLVEILTVFMK